MTEATSDDAERVSTLGRGRSGVVLRCRDADGRDVARKLFVGDRAGKLVHYIFHGAPNPYTWSEDAVRCAVHRRAVLSGLVAYWFGEALHVAAAHGTGWNAEHGCFQLDTEFVRGHHVRLRHPFSARTDSEYRHLARAIMRPLQQRLAEAGFDGTVWQAGRGNPVALNNFLRRDDAEADASAWCWIDLESGVPALFPLDPLALVTFYLPRSLRHRAPLFDDVDVDRLRAYLDEHRDRLEAALGAARCAELSASVQRLDRRQRAWRSLRRVRRSITYRVLRGAITREQADWYAVRPLRWYAREARRGIVSGLAAAGRSVAALARGLLRFDYAGAARAVGRFCISQAYRARLAQRYVGIRIDEWERRGQLADPDAALLRERLGREDTGSYITDFGVHIAIKPLVKGFQWGVLPVLLAAGVVGPLAASVLLVFGGMIARSLYTGGRMMQAAVRGEPLPWLALGVGLLPVAGNVAYPLQLVYHGVGGRGKLAAFIVYDTLTLAGQRIPIWGGPDTATEHAFNHLAQAVLGGWAARRDPGTADR